MYSQFKTGGKKERKKKKRKSIKKAFKLYHGKLKVEVQRQVLPGAKQWEELGQNTYNLLQDNSSERSKQDCVPYL